MTATIDLVIAPRAAHISEKLTVRRILPFRARRMVGPFCFLDHMGPHLLSGDMSADVLSHPHIGLSTLTYLFEGCITHRDSLGSVQNITPGDVNWMTAGRGIVHAERIDATLLPAHPRLHGLQAWVALPEAVQECEPFFLHYGSHTIPTFSQPGVSITLVAGAALGHQAPVQVSSPLFYLKLDFAANGNFTGAFPGQEAAFYLIQGSVEIDGQTFSEPTLIVFNNDSDIRIRSESGALGMMLGGDPMPEGRSIFWNFVSTKKELIEQAKTDWRNQQFTPVPGETGFVPLP